MKENVKATFRKLNAAIGVPGCEQEVIRVVCGELKGHVDSIHVSTVGNVVAVKKGARPGPAFAVACHMDEVGYVVRNILPSGFLTVDKTGFPTEACAVGRKVWVSTKRIPGTFGIRPGHMMTPEEAGKVLPAIDNYIDIGCSSEAEARGLGIRIGDPVVFQSDFMEMANPDLVCTRAVDNRINCAVVIELLKDLKAEDFAGTVYGVFAVREESGMHGAANAIEPYDIDYAIALDTVPVADTPGSNPAMELPLYLGKGPALIVCETFGLCFQLAHPGVRDAIETCAQNAGIHIQEASMAFGGYCTDATAYAYAKAGVPTATIACPRRYSHSPVELVNLNDAADIVNLLRAMTKSNDKIDLAFVKL